MVFRGSIRHQYCVFGTRSLIVALSLGLSACNVVTSIRGVALTARDAIAPDAPTITSFVEIDVDNAPSFSVSNLETGATVTLYSDACITPRRTSTATGSSMVMASSALTKGTYHFYARQTDAAGNASPCALVAADYQMSGTPMVSQWQTTGATESITLPLRAGFTYHALVSWGDGTANSMITSSADADRIHTYASAGTHTVTIMGTMQAWNFANAGSKNKILNVSELGDLDWTDFDFAFHGCSNLTAVSGGVTSAVTMMRGMFYNAPSADPDTSGWDTHLVTDMSYMFAGSGADPDTSSWDVGLVLNMQSMFNSAMSATLSGAATTNWDTSSVLNMGSMFAGASNANPDTSNWDTSHVANFSAMFSLAGSVTPDTSGWNTSAATNMAYMFNQAVNANPDTATWNFAGVTDFSSMFTGVTLTTGRYVTLLSRIVATSTTTNKTLDGGNSHYNDGATGPANRTILVTGRSWTITDGGP